MSVPDIAKVRREGIRWCILLTLNNARPIGAHESMILSVVQAIYPDSTEIELRRELGYLESRDLIKINKSPEGYWTSSLTRAGVDLTEYTVDCEPGIARPVKYW